MNIALQRSLIAYLQLMRPANIVTAWTDILAGFAASGAMNLSDSGNLTPLLWLLLATTGLYGGGVVFNDVFDAELDAQERPERPIPSDRVSLEQAMGLGVVLLAIALVAAAQVSNLSLLLAGGVAVAALIYDAWGKHQPIVGPLNMGLCRGGNLLLGMSLVPRSVGDRWYLALLAIAYIAAVTAISRGEVHGGKPTTGWLALALFSAVILGLVALSILPDYALLEALPFLGLLAGWIVPTWLRAARHPTSEFMRTAVKRGVLALIFLNAALVAGFAGWAIAALVVALLPLSLLLAKQFAMT